MAKPTRDEILLLAEDTKDLSGFDLRGLDLEGAPLARINFRNANLEGVSFKNADLTESEFRDARMVDADFTGARMHRAVLIGANIEGARFDEAMMKAAFLNGTHAAGTSFKNTELRAARIGVPKFQPHDPFGAVTTFEGADMAWCLFGTADLTGVDFRNANLSHAHLYESEIRGALLDGATMTGVRLKRQPREYATEES